MSWIAILGCVVVVIVLVALFVRVYETEPPTTWRCDERVLDDGHWV